MSKRDQKVEDLKQSCLYLLQLETSEGKGTHVKKGFLRWKGFLEENQNGNYNAYLG